MDIQEHVPLHSLTTFRTGGPARFLLTLHSREEVAEAVLFAKEKGLPLVAFGKGSNMLPPDTGLNAVLVRYVPSGITSVVKDGVAHVTVEAGCVWDDLVAHAVENGWWGIENLSAVPGTVGAAVVQNIGAYGAVLGDTLFEVEAYDIVKSMFVTLSRDECDLGYRTSVFKKHTDRYVIVSVSFALPTSGNPNLSYRDLTVYFEKKPVPQTLLNVRNAVIEIRGGKFPSLVEYGTAGSFFLNPVFTEDAVKTIRAKYPDMPVYPLPEGGVKVPLAWIFDQVLKAKGRRVGGAFVWHKQPLVIAADVDAQTKDIVALAESVVADFLKETGIRISPEVRLFGDDKKKFE